MSINRSELFQTIHLDIPNEDAWRLADVMDDTREHDLVAWILEAINQRMEREIDGIMLAQNVATEAKANKGAVHVALVEHRKRRAVEATEEISGALMTLLRRNV